MAENSTTFANRDSPIPVISVDAPSPGSQGGSPSASRRTGLRKSLSADKLRDKLDLIQQSQTESSTPRSLQDRLLTKLLEQIIPDDEVGDSNSSRRPQDKRAREDDQRPKFSIPTMSNNFRRFNARIGVVFVFQAQLIRLLTWHSPTQTVALLSIYTFLCLDPSLLIVAPLALTLFFIMVPAFLARHPPPPSNLPTDLYPLSGPPLAPPKTVKPAPDLSRDFFRNMRDLQNTMEDFSRLHDATIAVLAPPTNFSNEALSSTIFVLIACASCLLFLTSQLLPWRAIALVGGWVAIFAGHPRFPDFLSAWHIDAYLTHQDEEVRSAILSLAADDIDIQSSPETREVEIFELQRRSLSSEESEFEPFVFSPGPYTPLSPARIAGDRPKGTPFFEDVAAPRGWVWADKKWTLDLLSREWVEDRCVTGVEVQIEGERWVSDILYEVEGAARGTDAKGRKKDRVVTWEEGDGGGKVGEWRRRRWVRSVQRKAMDAGSGQ